MLTQARLYTLVAALAVLGRSDVVSAAGKPTAVELVDRQLVAYNAKNLDAFLACYAPNAELLEHPDKSLGKGTAALRERYTQRFADPVLHATITNRIVMGNKVIDHEHIVRTWPEGTGTWEVVAIYEVGDGLISRVWFILGDKTVDAKGH